MRQIEQNFEGGERCGLPVKHGIRIIKVGWKSQRPDDANIFKSTYRCRPYQRLSLLRSKDAASSEISHIWVFKRKSTKKGEKYGWIYRDCHFFSGGLRRTRPELWEVAQQELSASPATIPCTKHHSQEGFIYMEFETIHPSPPCLVATRYCAASSHLLIMEFHLCTCVASLLALSISSEWLCGQT